MCARLRVRADACVREAAHMSVYGLCMCGRACVCACGCVRVFMRACVRVCVHACVRVYTVYVCMIIVLYYYCGARYSSVAECRTRNREREVFESPLIPFRSLGILFLFTMPQFTRLYK